MKKIVSILRLEFLPESVDVGLLVLRLWLGGSLLILHGWDKLSNFHSMSRMFPDFFGIGKPATLGLAVFGEVVCSLFLVFGFWARLGALGAAITMGVAFFLQHKGVLKGAGSGEMAFIYMAGFVTLFIAGAGKYAVEGGKSKGSAPRKPKPAA